WHRLDHIVQVHAVFPNRSDEFGFEEASDGHVALSFRSSEWSVIVSVHRGAATGACFLRLQDVPLRRGISFEVWMSV
ncbi:hypothetical protein K503DRAFT_777500, partial [Rhizopogon vinicolor AM-OR11-026]